MLNESKHHHPFVYQSLLSPKVKKSLFFISILLCCCEVFGGTTNSIVRNPDFLSQREKEQYSTRAVNYPNSEFEINYHAVSVSSHCRQQSGPGFARIIETASVSYKRPANIAELFHQVFCKKYLAHIYPSHNFW
jgi:hypothetical protein